MPPPRWSASFETGRNRSPVRSRCIQENKIGINSETIDSPSLRCYIFHLVDTKTSGGAVRQITLHARFLCTLLALSALFGVFSEPAHAQGGKASLQGIVQDGTGASVPGVAVTVTNKQTGLSQTATSNDAGLYVFAFLNPGAYTVSATKDGFKTERHDNFVLTVDQQANLNFSLSVGSVTEEVQVSATAEMLNTTSAALGQVIAEKAILELPLNGRNAANLSRMLGKPRLASPSASRSRCRRRGR